MSGLRKGEILEFEIADIAFGARGVARTENFVWFIDRALPGQRVKARVCRIRKQYGEAVLQEVVREAPDRVAPPCPHFGTCGGCQMQHWAYPSQVAAKTRQVEDILRRIGGFPGVDVRPTLPASEILGYRNKMEFTFSDRRWIPEGEDPEKPADFALGLHVPGRFDKVLDLDACLLQSDRANQIFRHVRELTFRSGLPPYGQKSHDGFWRFLILREGRQTGDLMVNLITSGGFGDAGLEAVNRVAEALRAAFPEITTLVHGITDSKGQVARGESGRILWGSGNIREILYGMEFEVSSDAFFQTNTLQAEVLFDAIAGLSGFQGDEVLYDLYCGTGAIGIALAGRVRRVLGVEAIPSAVANARENAALNRLDNVDFVLADMKDALRDSDFVSTCGRPDVVIIDPPRGGTHPKTIQDLLALGAPRLIYVSCNPPLLARDCQALGERYRLDVVQPVDMFPHTKHIEAVARFTLR
ncbi:MAG TPA: 23S rRNA (uracil(1939)-C(5))-methyltransferase RlmD [bacterium]|nr:23S rRNA (uracil(1939)-C(5))-methyltransferase RlmD [bacterium]